MTKSLQVFTAVVLLGLAGCQSNRIERAGQPSLTIRVVGPAGASFSGTVEAGGAAQDVSGTVPAELRFASSRLSCRFQQGPEPGELRFEVYEGTRLMGSVATTGPRGHCRFRVRHGVLGGRTSWRFAKD